MINLDSVLKSRDITLPTKVCLVKAIVFPVVTQIRAVFAPTTASCAVALPKAKHVTQAGPPRAVL